MAVDFKALRASLAGLTDAVRQHRAEIEKLKRQREDIASAAPARSDVAAMLEAWVDQQAEQFSRNFSGMLDPFLKKATNLADPTEVKNMVGLLSMPPAPGHTANLKTADVALAGLMGPQIKTHLAAIVADLRWPGPEGLPLLERIAEADRLSAQIKALETEEAELVAQAASAGIVLDRVA